MFQICKRYENVNQMKIEFNVSINGSVDQYGIAINIFFNHTHNRLIAYHNKNKKQHITKQQKHIGYLPVSRHCWWCTYLITRTVKNILTKWADFYIQNVDSATFHSLFHWFLYITCSTDNHAHKLPNQYTKYYFLWYFYSLFGCIENNH